MKRLLAPLLILVLILGVGLIWYKEGLLPADPQDKRAVIFVIEPGSSVSSIAWNLESQKLIRSRLVFYLLVKTKGLEKRIQFGDFRLTRQMSASEIAQELTHGTLDVWVTIIEGTRVEEIASVLARDLNIPESVFLRQAESKEGYLFPDTYLIPKRASASQVIAIMENNFNTKISDQIKNNISRTGLSLPEAIVLASLLEREAKNYEDKRMITGIILNRLNEGMALQIDATVQYAIGYVGVEQGWWKRHLSIEDLQIESLYNTYLYPGLPPGPIANPGLESILAVSQPRESDYFFYLTDSQGRMHYGVTLQEHNKNITRYLN